MARYRAARKRRSLIARDAKQLNGENKFIVPPKPGDSTAGDSNSVDPQAGDSKSGNPQALGSTAADTNAQGQDQNGAQGISKKERKRRQKKQNKDRKKAKRNVGSLFLDPGVEEVTVLLENGVERTYKRSGEYKDGAPDGEKKGLRTPKFEVLEKRRNDPSENDAQQTNGQEPSETRDPTNEQDATADTEPHTPSPQRDLPTDTINPTSSLAIQPGDLPALSLTPRKRHSDSFREIANSQASEASDDSFHDSQEYPDFYDEQLGSAALTTPEARSVGWVSSPVLGGSPVLGSAERRKRRGSSVVGEGLPLMSVSSVGAPELASPPPAPQTAEPSAAEEPQIPDAPSRPQELPGLHPTEEPQVSNTTPLERGRSPLIGEEVPAVTGVDSVGDPEPSISPSLVQQSVEPSTTEGLQVPDVSSHAAQELPSLHPAEEVQDIETAPVPPQRLPSPHLAEEPQAPIDALEPSQRLPSLRPRRPATRSQQSQNPPARDRTETSPTPDTAPQPSQQLPVDDRAEESSIPDTAPQPSQQFPVHDEAEGSSIPDTAPQPSQRLPTLDIETEGSPTPTEPEAPEPASKNNKRPNDVTTTPPKKRARRSLPKSFATPPWGRGDAVKESSSASGAERTRRVSRSGLSRAIPARSEEEEMAQVVAEAARTRNSRRTTRSGLVHRKVSTEEIEAAFPDPDPDPEFGLIDGSPAAEEAPASSSIGEGEAGTAPRTEDDSDEAREDAPMLPPPPPAPWEQDDEGAVSDESSYTNVMSTPLRDYSRDFMARSRASLTSAQRRTPASKRTPTSENTPASRKSSAAKPLSTRAGVRKPTPKTRSALSRSAAMRIAELPTSSAPDSVTDASASKVSTPGTTPDEGVPGRVAAPPDDDDWVPKVMPSAEARPMIPLPTMGRANRNSRLSFAPAVSFGTPYSARAGARSVRGDWRGSVPASRASGASPVNGWASRVWGSSPDDAPPQTPTPAGTKPADAANSSAEVDPEPYFAVDMSRGEVDSANDAKPRRGGVSARTPASVPQRRTRLASAAQARPRTRSAARAAGGG